MHKLNHVYLIDDDEIIIYLTEKLIKKNGFCEVLETFTDAKTALKKLKEALKTKEGIPEVVLFDLNMPMMNGWEFLEEFKKLKFEKEIPTFVFTSSIDPNDKQKSFQYPEIYDFITKPLTVNKLDKILRLIDE